MDEARKHRPCVVIGTYDSCHHNHHHHHPHHHQQPNQEEQPNFEKQPDDKTIVTDFDQSTDLFSYCRSSQYMNYNHLLKSNQNFNSQRVVQPTKLRLKLNLNQIKGPTGSVRGHKDVVRKSLENIRAVASISSKRNFNSNNIQSSFQSSSSFFNQQDNSTAYDSSAYSSFMVQQMDEQHRAEYLERLVELELGQCVAYTTTLGVIRRTYEDCKHMRSILNSNLIKYEERDIYLNQEYKKQLLLRCNAIQVPVLFVDGKYFGAIKEIEQMNENGKLAIQLAQFKMSEALKHVCHCCGNAKFIACQSCNGSRKSTVHHFKYNSIALRCIRCDKNDGLVDCPVCSASNDNHPSLMAPPKRSPNKATETTTTTDTNNNIYV